MMAHTSTVDESHEQMSEIIASMIKEKGLRDGSAFINNECVKGKTEYLNCVLDVILNPEENIDNPSNINWCKWLIAGGRTPDDFATIGEVIDIRQLNSSNTQCTFYFLFFYFLISLLFRICFVLGVTCVVMCVCDETECVSF